MEVIRKLSFDISSIPPPPIVREEEVDEKVKVEDKENPVKIAPPPLTDQEVRDIEDICAELEKLYTEWKRKVVTKYRPSGLDLKELRRTAAMIVEHKCDLLVFFSAQVQ